MMQTENGLMIRRVDLEHGGFDVELLRPNDDDHEDRAFATLRYNSGWTTLGWSTNRDDIRAVSLVSAINMVEQAYVRERRSFEAAERAEREERDARNASVNPHWQEVVEHFGQEDDATD